MKRTKHNALAPIDRARWLVIRDKLHGLVSHVELAPYADPAQVLAAAMERLEQEGWSHEEAPSRLFAGFFTRRGGVRWLVHIESADPVAPPAVRESPAWSAPQEGPRLLFQEPEQRDD